MSTLELLPARIAEKSISQQEIVLPMTQALEAIDLLEAKGLLILGWEGWVKTASPGSRPVDRRVSFIGAVLATAGSKLNREEQMFRSKNMSWLSVGVVALAGSMIGFAHAASPASADETAIRAQTTSWVKAYNGGDAKAVAALYTEDALLLPPGAPGVRSRAAILEFLTKDIAGSKAAGAVFVVDPQTDVGVSGNMGWESGTYKVTVKGAVVETGKFLSVSRKKDGKWLYIRDTWNADAPPAPPAPPAAPPAAKK